MKHFDANWSLFLDRDGVINKRLPGKYVQHWEAFEFLPGVLKSLAVLGNVFGTIVIVTNQQGIGKGIMTANELHLIHEKMLSAIQYAKGRIDRIYYCGALSSDPHNCRKPAPAMALQAQNDFPTIDFTRSVMVGDSISDIQFGQHVGMHNILITTKQEEAGQIEKMKLDINGRYPSLKHWVDTEILQ